MCQILFPPVVVVSEAILKIILWVAKPLNMAFTPLIRLCPNMYSIHQCCGAGAGAGAARSRNFWLEPEPELEPEYWSFDSGSGSRSNSSSVFNHNSYWIGSKSEISQYSLQKVMKNLLYHLKAVKAGTQKASVGASSRAGAGAGAGAETFWKSKPELERKQIVSALQHWYSQLSPAFTHKIQFKCLGGNIKYQQTFKKSIKNPSRIPELYKNCLLFWSLL